MSGKILKEVFETKLLFKQRLFSWFDSYDIYDETEQTVYVVKGQLAWGHCLKIFSVYGEEVGTVKEKVLTLLPKFEVYEKERYIGCIQKELTFLNRNTILILTAGISRAVIWNGTIRLLDRADRGLLQFRRSFFI